MPKYSTIDFSLIKGNPSKIADKILPFIFFPRFYDLFSLLPHFLCTDSASNSSVYAFMYGEDATLASKAIFLTSVSCVVTIPIVFILHNL